MQEEKKLYLLDAFALIFRAYYAFIKNPRINSKGINTSAVFGFTNTLLEVIHKEKPSHIAVCFDLPGKTFRHDDYSDYKANRDETPEGISIAIPYIKAIIEALKIPILGLEGYEADDIIGTLAKKAEKEGFTTYMMTSDKDFAQLVTENIKMYRPAFKGGMEVWGIREVQEKFGVEKPIQVIDLLGMMGDAVDNIPGLPGVGQKTAVKFIQQYGSLENLFEHTHELKGKIKEKIEENKELGLLSKKLATIEINAPIPFEPEKLILEQPDFETLTDIFNDLEFRRIIENLYRTYNVGTSTDSKQTKETQNKNESNSFQTNLFESHGEFEMPENQKFQNLDSTSHIYQTIETPFAMKLFIDNLMAQNEVCFDTETTSLNTLEAELVGIAFSYSKGQGFYIPFPEEREKAQELIEVLRPFFEKESILKIGHNLKYDYKVLDKYNIKPVGNLFDTMIAHYLLFPDGRHGMDILAENILQYQPKKIESLIGKKGKGQLNFKDVPLKEQTEYAVEDADITFQLYQNLLPKIKENQLENLFYEVEMPLMVVLMKLELEGITVDVDFLKDYSTILQDEILEMEKIIFDESGETFNLNSPKQLGEILFDKLKLDPKAKKTKTGQYKTGEDVLLKLENKHSIISHILNNRQLQKLKSTYVDALPLELNHNSKRIHTTFAQTVAATGRLASVNPNLQNIPIKTARGREVRKAFVAKNKDFTLLAADYSQIELRLIAAFSQDPEMTKAFIQGEDIHSATASKIFNVDIQSVTREQRGNAKTVNFGIIYGVSAFGLSEQTGLNRTEAKELIEAYYQTYPSLKKYMENQVLQARENGFVQTILGRKRYLPDISSQNQVVRGHAERNAVNAPIQGSAADIIKLAMINIQSKLEEEKMGSKMLLQVHDELVFEVPNEELDTMKILVKNLMENAYETIVPLVVEVGVGNNWLEAH